MDDHKKLDFIHKMATLGLKHYDSGGTVLSGPNTALTNQNAANPNTGIGGTIGGILGLNNNFQASSANIQQGTNASQLNQAYNGVQNALTGQQNLSNTFAPGATTAVNNQNALASQLFGMTQGQGPNPALAQLNQTTGQNIANQAALMAGQRGSNANIGLLARQAAQQGAATQQQAVGQGASLEAQQQIAAQQNLANLAAQQAGQAQNAAGQLSTAQQGEQGILQNANTAANNAAVGMQSNINTTNAGVASGNQGVAGKILGGIGSGISSAIGSLFAEGGKVDSIPEMMAKGGSVHKDHFHKHISGYFAEGGKVPAMVSPGEIYLSPDKVHKVLNEGANPLKIGHRIPGKAKVKGDSYSNDTVPAMLEHGGVVVDRKNAMDPHKAMLFVHQSMHKRRSQS